MKETFSDYSYNLFYKISGKEPTQAELFFSQKNPFPKITHDVIPYISIPVPQKHGKTCSFLGFVFSDHEKMKEPVWSLYFSCLVKSAATTHVFENMDLINWKKNKNDELSDKVIGFIRNILAENYLQESFPDYLQEIKNIEKIIIKNSSHDSKWYRKEKTAFIEQFSQNKISKEKLKSEIINGKDSNEKLTEIANYIYANQHYLQESVFPDDFENFYQKFPTNEFSKIQVSDDFKILTEKFYDLWISENIRLEKIIKKHSDFSKDLSFDEVNVGNENIHEYLRLKNESLSFIKKLRTQLKMISNIIDDPTSADMGDLEMQKAIQATARNDGSVQMFEQLKERRLEENWAIILDNSASMKLNFDEMKKFALCLSETAHQINTKDSEWGFYCFNNKFSVIKDHSEKYSQNIQSRIGGITHGGLSFISDGLTLASRMFESDKNERKFIFVISDGHSLGNDKTNDELSKTLKHARHLGINVIGIGVPDELKKYFTITIPFKDFQSTITKFLNSYIGLVQSNLD